MLICVIYTLEYWHTCDRIFSYPFFCIFSLLIYKYWIITVTWTCWFESNPEDIILSYYYFEMFFSYLTISKWDFGQNFCICMDMRNSLNSDFYFKNIYMYTVKIQWVFKIYNFQEFLHHKFRLDWKFWIKKKYIYICMYYENSLPPECYY